MKRPNFKRKIKKLMPVPVLGAVVKAAAEIKNIPVEIRQNHTDPIRAQRRELRKLLTKAQFTEFGKFYSLLCGGEQEISYDDFIAPVFVLNAIDRSIKSGKTETVNYEKV